MEELERRDFSGWFNYWHIHPDLRGRARSEADRAQVAVATYALLLRAEDLVAQSGRDIQAFATICAHPGDNAVYLHSENPHDAPYPHEFPDVDWGVDPPAELTGGLDARHEVGRASFDGVAQYIIRRRIRVLEANS